MSRRKDWRRWIRNPWVWIALAFLAVLKVTVYAWLLLNYPWFFALVVSIKFVLKFSVISAAFIWIMHKSTKLVRSLFAGQGRKGH